MDLMATILKPALDARKNFALLTATYGVGFDYRESAFDGHNDLLRKEK